MTAEASHGPDGLERPSGATSTRRSSRPCRPAATTPRSRSSTRGVGTDGSDTRNTSITVYGSTGLENTYLVDGANTTGVEFGSQGKTLNFEFIQEVEFKSGGYEAEYGGSTGGILNVVTKSGGNEFHGDAFGYFNNAASRPNNKHTEQMTPDGIPTGFSKDDYGADVGGFIAEGPPLVLRRLRPREQQPRPPGHDRSDTAGTVRRTSRRRATSTRAS